LAINWPSLSPDPPNDPWRVGTHLQRTWFLSSCSCNTPNHHLPGFPKETEAGVRILRDLASGSFCPLSPTSALHPQQGTVLCQEAPQTKVRERAEALVPTWACYRKTGNHERKTQRERRRP
jgi:hypothetical protein